MSLIVRVMDGKYNLILEELIMKILLLIITIIMNKTHTNHLINNPTNKYSNSPLTNTVQWANNSYPHICNTFVFVTKTSE